MEKLFDWVEAQVLSKPISLPNPKPHLCLFVQMDDPRLFPTELGQTFPPGFREVIRRIFKRLFRVYAHIYHSHFRSIVALNVEAHLNTCFKHFIYFTKQFGLIDEKELAPLKELIAQFIH